MRRHLFHKTSCKQLRIGITRSKFATSKELTDFLRIKYSGAITTIAMEEAIGAAKDFKQSKQARQF